MKLSEYNSRSTTPTLFNINTNELIIHWNQVYSGAIEINDNTVLNTLLFADDRMLLSHSEDDLQRGLCTIHNSRNQFQIKHLH